MIKVLWPPTVAIVFMRSQVPGKVIEDHRYPILEGEEVAYGLGFSREEIIWGKAEISPKDTDILGLSHVYKCPLWGAYYLPRVVVRPLEGKMLPKGIIHVHLDGQLIAEAGIASFLPDPEPIDCMEAHSWRRPKGMFRAHTLVDGGADGSHQIGFMMPNLSKVEVQLTGLTTEEKMTLEVGLLSAYYSTSAEEMKDKELKL